MRLSMKKSIVFLALVCAVSCSTSLVPTQALAQFFVVPVGGARIDPDNVVFLTQSVTSGPGTVLPMVKIQADGSFAMLWTVPEHKLLVLSGMTVSPDGGSADGNVRFELTQSADDYNPATGYSIQKVNASTYQDHNYSFGPGILIDSSRFVRLHLDETSANGTVYVYGYLVNE